MTPSIETTVHPSLFTSTAERLFAEPGGRKPRRKKTASLPYTEAARKPARKRTPAGQKAGDSLFPETYTLGNLRLGPDRQHGLKVVLFAGMGGADEGLRQALGQEIDLALNHWPVALGANRVQHKETTHLISDILEVNPANILPFRTDTEILWASPDCTSFSSASGGSIITPGLRMLPWKIPMWVNHLRPRFLMGENVMAMRTNWGPLVAKRDKETGTVTYNKGRMVMTNTPHKKKKNKRWKAFVASIERLGYTFESRVLNAADYGAPTKRRRLIFVASRDGEPFPWPVPTHGKAGSKKVLSGELLPWVAAGPLLDYSLPVPTIFDLRPGANGKPNKMLKDNTLGRCARGLLLEVLETDTPYLLGHDQAGVLVPQIHKNAPVSLQGPCTTLTTQSNVVTLATAEFARPENTVAAAFIQKEFGVQQNSGAPQQVGNRAGGNWSSAQRRSSPLSEGLPTITATDHNRLASVFLSVYHGEKKDKDGKVTGNDRRQSLHEPAGTLDTSNRLGCAEVDLRPLVGDNSYADFLARTQDARSSSVAVMFQHTGNGGHERGMWYNCYSPAQPVRTLTAVSNKAGMLRVDLGPKADAAGLLQGDTRSETALLKRYPYCHHVYDLLVEHCEPERLAPFVDHGRRLVFKDVDGVRMLLTGVGLRMLDRFELGRVQGFPEGYVTTHTYDGVVITDEESKRMIGNSVPPHLSRALGLAVKPLLEQPSTDRPPAFLLKRWERREQLAAQAAD